MNKPVSLVIVAWIYIVAGFLACLDIIIALFSGRMHINLAALCLFAGIGLIRLQNGWRICALVIVWLFFAVIGLLVLFGIFSPQSVKVTVFSDVSNAANRPITFLLMIILVLVPAYWIYRVLTRPDVKLLFK
jgi:hypothetical protein